MKFSNIGSAEELMEVIAGIGFLPLLPCGISGFSVEEMVDADCRYQVFPDGGWDWPMWKWKGPIVRFRECTYGKFFNSKAGYVSMEWWRDLMNYRRNSVSALASDSIEEMILDTLQVEGSMITRDLRAACAFTGKNMRSRFDSYITRLQMQCRIVTEDFVYPHDRHGREYGWGWSLLTTPEALFDHEYCLPPETDNGQPLSPEHSLQRIVDHLSIYVPEATEKQILKLVSA